MRNSWWRASSIWMNSHLVMYCWSPISTTNDIDTRPNKSRILKKGPRYAKPNLTPTLLYVLLRTVSIVEACAYLVEVQTKET
jgi:hypothetical protein